MSRTSLAAVRTDALADSGLRQQRVVSVRFFDAHVHLDKAHTWHRAPNRTATFWDALDTLARDKVNWTAPDLERRAVEHGSHTVQLDTNATLTEAIAMYRSATAGAAAGEPWCAYFASWAARQAGEPIGPGGQGLGYVGDIWNWAQSTGRAVPNGSGVKPNPGDLIVFGDHHVGLVDKVLPDGSIQTIEGNYSDQVSRVVRGAGEATGYVRMS